jgi:hypothetical protein
MMMSPVTIVVMMATVCATLRLEGRLHFYKIRSEAAEHILDDMVQANAKNLVSNFSRQNAGFPNATQGAQADWDLCA